MAALLQMLLLCLLEKPSQDSGFVERPRDAQRFGFEDVVVPVIQKVIPSHGVGQWGGVDRESAIDPDRVGVPHRSSRHANCTVPLTVNDDVGALNWRTDATVMDA